MCLTDKGSENKELKLCKYSKPSQGNELPVEIPCTSDCPQVCGYEIIPRVGCGRDIPPYLYGMARPSVRNGDYVDTETQRSPESSGMLLWQASAMLQYGLAMRNCIRIIEPGS